LRNERVEPHERRLELVVQRERASASRLRHGARRGLV
jgi:hypothetical protein